MYNHNKKAQMEIMGIAFVIVLAIFGFLLYLNLAKEEMQQPVKEYLQPKQSSAFIDVLLHTSVDCGRYGNKQLRELIIDCLSYEQPLIQQECELHTALIEQWRTYDPTDEQQPKSLYRSCQVVESFINMTAALTLEKWLEPYEGYYLAAYQEDDFKQFKYDQDILYQRFGNKITYLQTPSPYAQPCNEDAQQRRSRPQPLPLATFGKHVLIMGICYEE
ncbi:MAG: hypothetical protein QW594_00980 [Candidatus Woesearchaeota archaeon]